MTGFRPPPYPQEQLGDLHAIASEAAGEGAVDLSVGNPGDPLPQIVADALKGALDRSEKYPPSIGFPEFREAASGWMARRLGVEIGSDAVTSCVGTKEAVAALPRLLSLRDPERDSVLYPAISYPTYAMGAELAGLRAVPVPLDDAWLPDLSKVGEADAARALVLWLNEPGNPTGSAVTAEWYGEAVRWARERGVIVASDECYVEFVFGEERASTALSAGSSGVLAVHSLSKRSNMAGLRAGFIAGDPELVTYLGETRKHAGLIVAGPIQMAAAAAFRDDAHVDEQRERYRERRELALQALEGTGISHDGGPATFYLWLRDEAGRDGWTIAGELAKAGIVAAPGDLYGEAGGDHARIALVESLERLEEAFSRLRSVLGAR